jgi:predicted DNA-binding transcriptional regulator AlpA
MPKDDTLLTSPQAGLLLGKSARTVQRMAEAGALPVAQKLPGPNGAFLFRRSEIEALAVQPQDAA